MHASSILLQLEPFDVFPELVLVVDVSSHALFVFHHMLFETTKVLHRVQQSVLCLSAWIFVLMCLPTILVQAACVRQM